MFMLKLLTIMFFLYTTIAMVTHQKLSRIVMNNGYTGMKNKIIYRNSIGEKIKDEDVIIQFSEAVIFYLLVWIFYIIEVIYIAFSIKHDPYNYVVLGYLVFWLLMLVKAMTRKKGKDLRELNVEESISYLDELIESTKRVKLWSKIQYFIDFSFYIYMVYIYFIY